ncbi:LPPG:Fo 2-phospho-L-lactate transferase [Phenylobacterium zucineum HLK1]|uniref:LPPG:Fo 2-phospho-L-lactate transferase n=1 Tax=Phenylobacterium zucineum (strain HLK1) TaxID=450851 RepID=B4RGP1_PHEZH|nr:2-phospho-L-lactate transferase [Phenylobacterium zucineum]ACG78947.1 LPPG:Fo 2-phospho-L-lactate transferase [Phenylobacterium zucineum HLK1]
MSHVLALCGGVGGAKLAFGLSRLLGPDELTIAVNTADDFVHLGLHIAPDLDTVVYTLADLADRERGWGLAGETWGFMSALSRLGGEDWFNMGDHDLATHVERTRRLAAGESLSEATAALAGALGVLHRVTPMSDDPVRTRLATDRGDLSFQHYFVRERCAPRVAAIRFEGTPGARMSPGLAGALARDDLAAIVFCPSNPYLSVDPILAVDGVRAALSGCPVPKVAVSPIVGGQAIKGPAAKLMAELGAPDGNAGVAAHYAGLIDGLVLDRSDAADTKAVEAVGMRARLAPSVMRSDVDRIELARATLAFAEELRRG